MLERKVCTPRLVVECNEQRKRIIASIHDSNHLQVGVNRSLDLVKSKYYWPGLSGDVKQYVSLETVILWL